MNPTEELSHEHQVIDLVLEAAAKEARRMKETAVIKPAFIEKVLDFSRNFTDKCHHAKEEKHLFAMLEQKGMPRDSGLIAALMSEHDEGRRLLSDMSGSLPEAVRGDRNAIMSIAGTLEAYTDLLKDHIAKENSTLFPTADRMLSGKDKHSLESAFARVEEEETGQGVHEKYHHLAHEISDSAGI